MKHILITTIAAVLVVGCGESQQSAPAPEAKPVEPVAEATKPITPPKAVTANKGADPARGIKPEPPKAKAPDISIHDAAGRGNIEAIKQHLAAGADVNAKGGFLLAGVTPLYIAAGWGHKEVVELLINNGADVNAKGVIDITPLHNASTKEIAELLIAKGADVNGKNALGWTPLHFAASRRDKESAELLIAEGADVNAKDKNGTTPLDAPIRRKHPEIADLLRKHGGKTSEELKAEGN
jgi:hypothetical protein